ncbi:ATP/maltotriose-dependent transcriptional regulator MalT [Microbacterium sp. SLBN-154]|uniref:LuxR C-terminal-related transcriptional regulator n=1 Tax=Microbacterium sp. SLBN-154 TaxID=2768458 RepID=UPI00114EA0E0|nr:LuxR C-terminal-related transcriptional regulator [Microbacterium sp. SLBN-154]TQK19861.1 ATP/maltotriose-dependent transcriptional regulator MalT [Microbacterium sp. SLBN-154]
MPIGHRHTLPPHAVDRRRLRAQLDAGLDSPLSLVVAPAGAGKTVLLSQWVRSRADHAVAWVDVTEADADPIAFSRHLVDALTSVAPHLQGPLAPVDTSDRRLGEALLEDLSTVLASAGRIIIVFDDLDRMSGSEVLTDLWRLVDQLPPNVHVVFASRVDLKLGWSRHRLQHNLVEIRQRDLAFDGATTAEVLQKITGRPVTEKTAERVRTRTEGWAVGVQLTALSLRFSADPERSVSALTETDRLVADYLSEEVLDAQDPPRRSAIMRIAAVDEFCAPLVDAILGADGAQLIADLEQDSMFLFPLSGRPGWYRFHRLFRDLLLLRLRARGPDVERQVLRAAARWSEEQDFVDDAIRYHLRARSWVAALDLVLTLRREVYEDFHVAKVVGWLEAVPEKERARRPQAELLLAMARGMSGHGVAAMDAFRGLLEEGNLSAGERLVAQTYLGACVQLAPPPEFFAQAAENALSALAQEPPDIEPPSLLGVTSRPLLNLVARASYGRALLLLGDLDAARQQLRLALEGEGAAYRPFRLHALGSLALTEAFSERMALAEELADSALSLAKEFRLLDHPAAGDAFLARAVASLGRGDGETGAAALAEGRVRAASDQRTQLLWLAHLASVMLGAEESSLPTSPLAAPPPPFVRHALTALAHRRARLRGMPSRPTWTASTWSVIAFEEIAGLLTTGDAPVAARRLAQFEPPGESSPAVAVERDLLLGWAHALAGQPAQARSHLQAALALAASGRLLFPFAAAGPEVARLLEALPGPADEFRRLAVHAARAAGAAPARGQLVEHLTHRERELLAYLPTRMTFADIAAHSYVSVNTVKTHVGHIYRKLGVTGRDEAIERAADLGLIEVGEIARIG